MEIYVPPGLSQAITQVTKCRYEEGDQEIGMGSGDVRSNSCVGGTELNAPPWETNIIMYFSLPDEESEGLSKVTS